MSANYMRLGKALTMAIVISYGFAPSHLMAKATNQIYPLRIAVTLQSPVCVAGAPAFLYVTLKDRSPAAINLGGGAFDLSKFNITVMNGNGRKVKPTAYGHLILTPPMYVTMNRHPTTFQTASLLSKPAHVLWDPIVSLQPGIPRRYRFNLARMFDLSRPGYYQVHVERFLQRILIQMPSGHNKSILGAVSAPSVFLHIVNRPSSYSGPERWTPHRRSSQFLYINNALYNPQDKIEPLSGYRIQQDGHLLPMMQAAAAVSTANSGMAVTPDGHFLYVGNGNHPLIEQFRIGANGRITPLSPPTVQASFTAWFMVIPNGNLLYDLSESGNSFFAIGKNGCLHRIDIFNFHPWFKYQKNTLPSTNYAVYDPRRRLLYTINNGFYIYRLAANGRTARLKSFIRAGDEDRAAALTPSGKYLDILTSKEKKQLMQDRIVPVRVYKNGLSKILPYHLTPLGLARKAYGDVALALDPSGRFLLALNDGSGCIECYRIMAHGRLKPNGIMLTGGQPFTVAFNPANHAFYVLNSFNEQLVSFQLSSTGQMQHLGQSIFQPCSDGSDMVIIKAPTPLSWGTVSGGLEMAVRQQREVYSDNVPIVMTVYLKNISHHAVLLGQRNRNLGSFRFSLTGTHLPGIDTTPVAIPTDPKPLSEGAALQQSSRTPTVRLALPPGKERQYRILLSRLMDTTLSGDYRLTISYTLPEPSGKTTMVSSPTLQFRRLMDKNTSFAAY